MLAVVCCCSSQGVQKSTLLATCKQQHVNTCKKGFDKYMYIWKIHEVYTLLSERKERNNNNNNNNNNKNNNKQELKRWSHNNYHMICLNIAIKRKWITMQFSIYMDIIHRSLSKHCLVPTIYFQIATTSTETKKHVIYNKNNFHSLIFGIPSTFWRIAIILSIPVLQ